jgi:hypothetical protein
MKTARVGGAAANAALREQAEAKARETGADSEIEKALREHEEAMESLGVEVEEHAGWR